MIERIGMLRYIVLKPTGNGWNATAHRVWTVPKHYYGISDSSIQRFQSILNRDDFPNVRIELGRTGWAEIEFYPSTS